LQCLVGLDQHGRGNPVIKRKTRIRRAILGDERTCVKLESFAK